MGWLSDIHWLRLALRYSTLLFALAVVAGLLCSQYDIDGFDGLLAFLYVSLIVVSFVLYIALAVVEARQKKQPPETAKTVHDADPGLRLREVKILGLAFGLMIYSYVVYTLMN